LRDETPASIRSITARVNDRAVILRCRDRPAGSGR
jgi:hypothetical protein